MNRIYDIDMIDVAHLSAPRKQDWTAIIPAAGRGTRLGDSRPKILYPILGKPILAWLIASLEPFVERFVFVLSPDTCAEVESHLKPLLGSRYDIAIQPAPQGMADAVLCAKPRVQTKSSIVLWGDQVVLTHETIAACVYLHESRKNAALTLPTVWRSNPYIHFERNASQRLMKVYQAREETQPLEKGENDCGIFFFNTRTLFDIIETARDERGAVGQKTGEFNLLPLLPAFDKQPGDAVTLRIKRIEESMGVNTPEEARQVENILRTRVTS